MITHHPSAAQEASALEFATRVREQLSDLQTDEVDELTDGLQADLADRLAEGDELGDPADYASELRTAAGLPPRAALAPPGVPSLSLGESIRQWWITVRHKWSHFWGATAARRGLRDFAISIRPLWWVARGLTLAAFFVFIFIGGYPDRLFAAILALAFIVVSVQWGRGMWAPKRWLVWARRIAHVAAIVLLIPMTVLVADRLLAPQYVYAGDEQQGGLVLNGNQVSNLFAYDCAGQPLAAVQLFDQDGNPITTRDELWGDGEPVWGWDMKTQESVTHSLNGFALMPNNWNVFPLTSGGIPMTGEPGEITYSDSTPPFPQVPQLSGACSAAPNAEGAGEAAAE